MTDTFSSTSYNEWTSTAQNVWFGSIDEVDDTILAFAARRYYCTLTGAEDGLPDLTLPLSSFQARRRNGTPSYLSVVTPNIELLDDVALRPSGFISVEMSYWYNGVDNFRTEIARTKFETVVPYKGGTNSSLSLSGNLTLATVPKEVVTKGKSIFRSQTSGKLTHRMAEPEVFLAPGDTVTIGYDTYIVGLMSFWISTEAQTMEVTEA